MSTLLIIQNTTGASFSLNVDLASTTVLELKQTISTLGKGKSVSPPILCFKGHELRDDQRLDYYNLIARDTLHILPPSTTEKINLKFETDEGRKFHLNVDPNIKIGQLKREITLEEKIDAKQLRALMSEKDIDSLEYLPDEAILSTLNLGSQVISVYTTDRSTVRAGKRPANTKFGILLSIDERKHDAEDHLKFLAFEVFQSQTLAEFEDEVQARLTINLSNYTLILKGREMKEDGATLENLGFTPGSTLHAVADIHLCIPTPAKEFDMVVSPMTRIPTVRKTLIEVDPVTPWDEFAFSLDGNTRMKETSTMWDLDLRSPTILYLVKRYVSLTIRLRGGPEDKHLGPIYHVTAEDDELIEGLKQRIFLEAGIPASDQLLLLKDRLLQDQLTLKQEKVDGEADLELINVEMLGNI